MAWGKLVVVPTTLACGVNGPVLAATAGITTPGFGGVISPSEQAEVLAGTRHVRETHSEVVRHTRPRDRLRAGRCAQAEPARLRRLRHGRGPCFCQRERKVGVLPRGRSVDFRESLAGAVVVELPGAPPDQEIRPGVRGVGEQKQIGLALFEGAPESPDRLEVCLHVAARQ